MRTWIPPIRGVWDPRVTAAPQSTPEIQTWLCLCASPSQMSTLPSAIPASKNCFLSLSSLLDCFPHTAQGTAAPRLGSVIKQSLLTCRAKAKDIRNDKEMLWDQTLKPQKCFPQNFPSTVRWFGGLFWLCQRSVDLWLTDSVLELLQALRG